MDETVARPQFKLNGQDAAIVTHCASNLSKGDEFSAGPG